jgi:transposase
VPTKSLAKVRQQAGHLAAVEGWRRVYLRHTTRVKDGKGHTYWRLVRSVRRGGRVIQETVAQLGELDAQGRARAKALARSILGRSDDERQGSLFDVPTAPVAVRLDRVRIERGRGFGDVWLGWELWRALKFDALLAELLPEGRETIAWSQIAAILVIARLCEPSSELHIAEDWYRRTALDDLLGVASEHVYDARLYRALDRLLPHKEAIEKHLVKRLGELFAIEYDLLLYDVTSTYFEGVGAPTICKRGYSRDHRPDCVQVNIALVVTKEGFPLGYELFEGNRADVTTVEEIVTTMEKRYGKADRVWVMDRGMVSAENIEWLQEGKRRYILGAARSEIKKWDREFADKKNWQTVREGIAVKSCQGPDGEETFVLCRSTERVAKERAMHERFCKRIDDALKTKGRRLARSRRRLDRGILERQIGRLLERNARAAGRYHIEFVEDSTCAAGVRLQWSVRKQWEEWAQYSEGSYILRTNITDWKPEALWTTYIQLTEAEAAFRIHKSQLAMRPIWHQKSERIKAHILVCFLAYVLWKTLEKWQSQAGLGNSPRTVLEELARIQSTDVVLPLADNSRGEMRLRCVVRPDKAQAALLDRLGLTLPQRLRPPMAIREM